MKYNLINLTRQVYAFAGKELDESNRSGVKLLIKMVGENELQLRNHLFDLDFAKNSLKESLNNADRLQFDVSSAIKVSGCVDMINRGKELIFVHLRDILAPYWKVYWSEGCSDLDIIYEWVKRAEEDSGNKLNQFKKNFNAS